VGKEEPWPIRPVEGQFTDDFASMIRARRRELGLTQGQVAPHIHTEEGRSIGQGYLAEIERGHHPHPRPHLIEEFARALKLDRDVLYLAARQVPPEVAEQLRRLTPEERAAAWRVFKRAVMENDEERKGAQGTGESERSAGRKGARRRERKQ
jgi:transcriptional regulator with XRE-family HTH domain